MRNFTGAVSGFNEGDSLDLGDVAFGNGTGTTLSYSANEAGTVYVGTDLKSVPQALEREADLKRRAAAGG